jgi:hypothetical protein
MKEKNEIRKAIMLEQKKQRYYHMKFIDCDVRIAALKHRLYEKSL